MSGHGASSLLPAEGAARPPREGAEGLWRMASEETALHTHFGGLVTLLEWAAALIDICAILILLIGGIRFVIGVGVAEIARRGSERVRKTNRERIELGRYILAGLELFIVSDVIHTALSLAMADLLFLLILVVIRSITSYFLERELDGVRRELGT